MGAGNATGRGPSRYADQFPVLGRKITHAPLGFLGGQLVQAQTCPALGFSQEGQARGLLLRFLLHTPDASSLSDIRKVETKFRISAFIQSLKMASYTEDDFSRLVRFGPAIVARPLPEFSVGMYSGLGA
jgi:hypothetical protein